jgi:hypothetical protein
MGYTAWMAVPNLIIGVGHKISYPKRTRIVYFPVSSNHGDFIMEIFLQNWIKIILEKDYY